jgi:hypothetical protein
MTLAIVVLLTVGGFLINSTRAEREITTAVQATNLGQVIVRSLQSGVRNSSHVRLKTVGQTQLLIARTAENKSSVVWSCQAWYFDPASGGSLYTKKATPAVEILSPTSDTITSWTLLGTGVSVAGSPVFDATLGRVDIALTIGAGNDAPVSMNSRTTIRQLPSISLPCF